MTVEIIPSTIRDITIVGANMREHDRREFYASGSVSLTEAAIACHLVSPGWAWVALFDGEPVAAIGIASNGWQPQLRSAWAFGTDRFKRAVPTLSVLASGFRDRLLAEGVRRVEARSLVGHDLAGRWMQALGGRHEAVLRRYGRGGEDFDLWAWTDE